MTTSIDQFNPPPPAASVVPRLADGQRLDQAEFHRRYLSMPPDFRAELIEGVVVVSSPQKPRHGGAHGLLMYWLGRYAVDIPEIDYCDNTTAILGASEYQPDAYLLVAPSRGGQSSLSSDGYAVGPLELVLEIADSTESIDLNSKFREYQKAGVKEYLVVLLRRQAVRWFMLDDGLFREATAVDGVLCSQVFPGLWLNVEALLCNDRRRLTNTLELGMRSSEHAEFLKQLRQSSS